MQIMNRIDDKNDWNDIDCMLNAGKRALIPDHQFIKTVQECGRSLLNSSKRPAAITVRKDAAQTLIHTFKEKFGITYTENQIFKKFYNMKQRLRSRLNKKEPLTVSEELLKKLLDEEELRNASQMQTYEDWTATTSWNSVPEPLLGQSDDDISQYAPSNARDMNLDAVNHGDSLKADLHRKVLQEQLKILQKQLEVLDVQKEVYLLQKEELLAELNEYKSMEDL